MKNPSNLTALGLGVALALVTATTAAAATQVTALPTPHHGKRARAVTDAGGNVHLIYHDHGNIFYCRRAAGTAGAHFSDPVRVNSVDHCAAVGDLAVGAKGRVHVVYHGNIHFVRDKLKREGLDRKLQGTDIKYTFYSRLNDAGDGFEEQRDLSGPVWGFDGGCTLAADGDGNVYVFMAGTTVKGKEKDREVFLRHSADGGRTFAEARPVGLGKGVCACCHLKASAGPDGSVRLVYRVAEESVNRDSYVLVSKDRGKTFSPSPLDQWKLNACPGTVYTFAETADGFAVSWRNQQEVSFKPGLEAAPITPPGKTANRRAAVLASNHRGEFLIAWAEGKNFNRPHGLRWQLYGVDGKPAGDPGGMPDAFQRWGNAAVFAEADGDFVVLY